jgi:hypothetical protein
VKPLDIKSTIVAGLIGALLFALKQKLYPNQQSNCKWESAYGFVFGVLVQAGVRITGVS